MSPAVIVSNLSKRFGRCKALDGVSLVIEPGEIRARLLHGSAKAGRNNSSHRGINRDSNRESW